jgi:isopenicillin N synthase-like dioxygenase
MAQPSRLPVIDVAPLLTADAPGRERAAAEIGEACRSLGFFYASGHAISGGTLELLDRASREFFALSEEEKLRIAMPRGGRAWRGFFPVGGELTSGRPDIKEGVYFGEELGADDPRVKAGCRCTGGTCSRMPYRN